MTWRDGKVVPIRTFPFDVPKYAGFGGDFPPFGGDGIFNMSGRWLFLSETTPEEIRQTPTFDALVFLDPSGATGWSIDEEGDYQGYAIFCRDEDLFPQSEYLIVCTVKMDCFRLMFMIIQFHFSGVIPPRTE